MNTTAVNKFTLFTPSQNVLTAEYYTVNTDTHFLVNYFVFSETSLLHMYIINLFTSFYITNLFT